MDNIDFDELLKFIRTKHHTDFIPYKIIDRGLRKQKVRIGSDPIDIKSILVDTGFAEFHMYGGNKCVRWTKYGRDYANKLVEG